jgi:hypothetical protein
VVGEEEEEEEDLHPGVNRDLVVLYLRAAWSQDGQRLGVESVPIQV